MNTNKEDMKKKGWKTRIPRMNANLSSHGWNTDVEPEVRSQEGGISPQRHGDTEKTK